MFRGGYVSSYGNGIASGLADGGLPPKRGFVDGPGGYSGEGYYTGAYPNPDNLYSSKGVTGAEIVAQAKKKLNAERFPGENQLWKNISKADAELLPGTAEKDIYNLNKEPPAIETWYKKQSPTYVDVSKYESIPHYEEGGPGYIPEELLKMMKDKEDSVRENYMSGQSDAALESQQQLKEILEKQRVNNEAEGKHPLHQDYDIPAGVSEQDQGETVTSGEQPMGLQELADAYYERMSMGEEERKNQRAEEAAKRRETAMTKARTGDVSDYLLKFFEGSQKEGATVGSAAADVAAFATAKDSKTEKAMAKADAREEALMDRGYAREDALRDRATAAALKEKFTQMGFDWKDMRSEKDFDNKMEMLKIQLESAERTADKKIIAARINTLEQIKNKIFAPGITEKDITWAMKQPKDSAEYTAWLNKNNYASTLEAHVKDQAESLDGRPMSNSQINKLGPLYYDDWGGIFIQDGDQKDGTYLDTKMNEIVTIKDGKVVEALTESLTVS
jgi:hypothetical protein